MSVCGNGDEEKRHLSRREFIAMGGMSTAAVLLGPGTIPVEAGGQTEDLPEGSFQFGLVADAQYGDYPSRGNRHYRQSLGRFDEAAETFNGLDLAFTAHLGDLIDRGKESFEGILRVYEKTRRARYHVLGNHDFSYENSTPDEVVQILEMPGQYYEFFHEGWRFVVLDTNDISLYANPEGSEKHERAREMYEELKASGAVNAPTWAGAVGDEQMAWLRDVLAGAQWRGERVIVLSHMPVYPKSAVHNAWNGDALVELFESYGNTVVAYFNGHNHAGNYGQKEGIHYVNLCGMVEADSNAYSVVRVHADRLEIDGYGREPDRVLRFEPNAAKMDAAAHVAAHAAW